MTNALDKVREAALDLPETAERLSHGQPTFFVAGKQFAQFRDNHHGDDRTVVCVRTSGLDEQAMLLESDPETYSKPAYLHHAGWISINVGADEDGLGPCREPHRSKLGACGAAALAGSRRTMSDSRDRSQTKVPLRWVTLGEVDRDCSVDRLGGRRLAQLQRATTATGLRPS